MQVLCYQEDQLGAMLSVSEWLPARRSKYPRLPIPGSGGPRQRQGFIGRIFNRDPVLDIDGAGKVEDIGRPGDHATTETARFIEGTSQLAPRANWIRAVGAIPNLRGAAFALRGCRSAELAHVATHVRPLTFATFRALRRMPVRIRRRHAMQTFFALWIRPFHR
jgi:hypothetical protein